MHGLQRTNSARLSSDHHMFSPSTSICGPGMELGFTRPAWQASSPTALSHWLLEEYLLRQSQVKAVSCLNSCQTEKQVTCYHLVVSFLPGT